MNEVARYYYYAKQIKDAENLQDLSEIRDAIEADAELDEDATEMLGTALIERGNEMGR